MKETGLIKYDAMVSAIAEVHTLDEIKDIRDKMIALEKYAAQAMNMEAERKACEIRIRAERRAGEIQNSLKRNPGKRSDKTSLHAEGRFTPLQEARQQAGISDSMGERWQRLANVDEDEFEAILGDPEKKPSTTGVIRKHNGGTDSMNPSALWLWGRLRDFDKKRIEETDAETAAGEMTETMRNECLRIIPCVKEYLSRLEEIISKEAK